MTNKAVFNNAGDIVVVQCDGKDVVGFISDLQSNLDLFELGSYSNSENAISFTCTATNHSSEIKVDYKGNFRVRVTDKVLIKNKRIVTTHCNELLENNLITLE